MSIIRDRRQIGKGASKDRVDQREALFNDGAVGPANVIQVPAERITRLRGLLLDLDPKMLIPDNPIFPPSEDPRRFFEAIEHVLNRHPLVRHAEIRSSGTGLHAIIRYDSPVELKTGFDQKHWAILYRAVQSSLPSDPNAPGITGLTRPIGSINSKNEATVEVLRLGEPIDPVRVGQFVAELADAPFRTLATILLGADTVEPCPLCRTPGSRLGILDRVGKCYGCGKVTIEMLYDAVLACQSVEAEEADTEPDETGSEPSTVAAPKGRRNPGAANKRQPGKGAARR